MRKAQRHDDRERGALRNTACLDPLSVAALRSYARARAQYPAPARPPEAANIVLKPDYPKCVVFSLKYSQRLRHSSHPTQRRLGKPPPVIAEEKQEDIGSEWKNASRPHLFAWSPESSSIEGKSPQSSETESFYDAIMAIFR
jgi:hypothetical protein